MELSNLQRQIIHNTSRLGQKKVDSAKETIELLNPDVTVKTYAMRLTPENIGDLIEEYDFVVDGVDNFETKFLINDACVLAGKPFCHGGILRFQGQVMTYVPGQGPCYRCIFEEIPEQGSVPNCSEAGVIGVMAGIIGCVQGLETIKYLLGIGRLLTGRMVVFDGLNLTFREVKFGKAIPTCKVCGEHPEIKDLKAEAWRYESHGICTLH